MKGEKQFRKEIEEMLKYDVADSVGTAKSIYKLAVKHFSLKKQKVKVLK